MHTLTAYLTNAENRYDEDKPRKWWVMVEFLIMGVIAGYFIPEWLGMACNPHKRDRIDDLMRSHFTGGFDHLMTDDVLLIAYDYNAQKP